MDPRFDQARAAILEDDAERLEALIAAEPSLATDRSLQSCDHPTLLQCLVLTEPPPTSLEAMIRALAARGAELSGPFVAAAGIGNVTALRILLDLGVDIDEPADWSALDESIYRGKESAVDLLLEKGAVIRTIRAAAALGDLEYVDSCFDGEGDLVPKRAGRLGWPFGEPRPATATTDPGEIVANALVHASAWGVASCVSRLLDRGSPIDHIPAGFDFAGTALHYAALRGRHEVVDLLLARGASAAVPDAKIGRLPEHWAEHEGHFDLARKLERTRLNAVGGGRPSNDSEHS
jgi:ankyrin repeat protein